MLLPNEILFQTHNFNFKNGFVTEHALLFFLSLLFIEVVLSHLIAYKEKEKKKFTTVV